jgi:hypothetical protein
MRGHDENKRLEVVGFGINTHDRKTDGLQFQLIERKATSLGILTVSYRPR